MLIFFSSEKEFEVEHIYQKTTTKYRSIKFTVWNRVFKTLRHFLKNKNYLIFFLSVEAGNNITNNRTFANNIEKELQQIYIN